MVMRGLVQSLDEDWTGARWRSEGVGHCVGFDAMPPRKPSTS